MTSENLIARFEAKMDAQNAKIDAIRWTLGIGLAFLGILMTVFGLLG